ncbi:MAG: glycine--tRNA ligase subunit beta, partial [Actinomycetota bacterium]|nr:glycine--tRNA ligase subunit beta [Actinomycetota bacterium]
DLLPEQLADLVRGITFSKSMQWVAGGLRFARPVRWLCAKLDGETLSVDLDGVPSLGVSYGHRFGSGEIDVAHAGTYLDSLRRGGVEPDAEERRRAIVAGLDATGAWRDPGGKLEEVVYLVESPVVLAGSFEERFLQLPARVVETAMQSHQRYFPLGGNRFAFVANGGDPDVVRAGNEQVLESRLEDASFTFERDVEVGIEGLAGRLGSITFVAGARSFAEKSERLVRLVEALGGGEASTEAARLAKADQAAELVREFPDLEGHIGAEYARLAGYPEAVCAAIEEQYLPDSARGALPDTESGRVLAAAEKVDNLTVAFALGRRPSGSRDPYGLRRAAIGLCRLAYEARMRIDMNELSAVAYRLLLEQGVDVRDEPADLPDFVAERFEGMLDVPVEFVRAARASGMTELRTLATLAAVLAGLDDERLGRLHTAFSRAHRLAGKAEEQAAATLDAGLLVEDAERAVVATLAHAEPAIADALADLDIPAAIEAALELAAPVDRFFDEVLVMADDAAVRANRLRLLLDVRDALGRLGDFSEIPR